VSKVLNAILKLKKIQSIRPNIQHYTLLKSTLLVLILAIAFLVRVLPIRWGYYLNEFDSYYEYRMTSYIIDHGYMAWFQWHDYMSWYPWGNPIFQGAYPGLPMTAATLYMVLNALGISFVSQPSLDPLLSDPVYNFCVIFPVVLGTLACLLIYFLGKDLGGESVGLLAAFFLALDSSYIGRGSELGWFKEESLGIFAILLTFLFFNRSIVANRPLKKNLFYAIAAGLSLAYTCVSWGGSIYAVDVIVLYIFALIIMRRYSPLLLLSYGITFGLALPISINAPHVGYGFLFGISVLPVYGVLFLLCIAEINRREKALKKKAIYISVFIALLAVLLIFLQWKGLITLIGGKFLATLNPFVRLQSPLEMSVAEHQISAWGTFYYNWGIGIFFVPIGLFFAVMMATNLSIFICIYSLTSLYFASSLIRLNLLLSPAVCLLWALAIVNLMKPFILFLKEPSEDARRKIRFRSIMGKETAAGIIILMLIFLILTFVTGVDFMAPPSTRSGARVFSQAYTPTTIATAGMSVGVSGTVTDWLDACTWMRENLPPSPQKPGEPGTVIAAWWDYGYWITAMANRTTLADNGTWNSTQIQQIGLMFMSPEYNATKILAKYNVTDVVVFVTFATQTDSSTGQTYPVFANLGGDNSKWQWMARIPGLNDTTFGNYSLGVDYLDPNHHGYYVSGDTLIANAKGQNTTLYKLMTYGMQTTYYSYSSINLQYFQEAYFSQTQGSPTPAPGTSYYPLVCVYKVNYPQNSTKT
jgi:dolichyl-diphosphooligosaccharide--protein glycosyltransferase